MPSKSEASVPATRSLAREQSGGACNARSSAATARRKPTPHSTARGASGLPELSASSAPASVAAFASIFAAAAAAAAANKEAAHAEAAREEAAARAAWLAGSEFFREVPCFCPRLDSTALPPPIPASHDARSTICGGRDDPLGVGSTFWLGGERPAWLCWQVPPLAAMHIAKTSKQRYVRAGGSLYKLGDTADAVYVVRKTVAAPRQPAAVPQQPCCHATPIANLPSRTSRSHMLSPMLQHPPNPPNPICRYEAARCCGNGRWTLLAGGRRASRFYTRVRQHGQKGRPPGDTRHISGRPGNADSGARPRPSSHAASAPILALQASASGRTPRDPTTPSRARRSCCQASEQWRRFRHPLCGRTAHGPTTAPRISSRSRPPPLTL